MYQAFQYIDQDGSGRLEANEMARALAMWNLPVPEEARRRYAPLHTWGTVPSRGGGSVPSRTQSPTHTHPAPVRCRVLPFQVIKELIRRADHKQKTCQICIGHGGTVDYTEFLAQFARDYTVSLPKA